MSMIIDPTLAVPTTGGDLSVAIHDLVSGRIDNDEFARRFLASRVFMLSPVRPGPFVMSPPGGAAVAPVWSTSRGLLHVMGGYEFLVSTGEDLAARLPDGVGVLIDDGMPCPIALPSALLLGNRCRSS